MMDQMLTNFSSYIEYDELIVPSLAFVTFLGGCLQLSLYFMRAGSALIHLLPEPFTSAFSFASSFYVLGSQLKVVLGVHAERGTGIGRLMKTVVNTLIEVGNTNWISVVITLSAIFMIRSIPIIESRIRRRFSRPRPHGPTEQVKPPTKILPEALLTVAFFTVLSYCFNWRDTGLSVIGKLPAGLMELKEPWAIVGTLKEKWVNDGERDKTIMKLILEFAPGLFSTALVAFVTTYSTAKTFPSELKRLGTEQERRISISSPNDLPHDDIYSETVREVDSDKRIANQELLALSLSTIAGSFGQCIIPSASLSRTSILATQTPCKTPITHITAVIIVIIFVLCATDLLSTTPRCVLSAIIVVALRGVLSRWRQPIDYWRQARFVHKAQCSRIPTNGDAATGSDDSTIDYDPETASPDGHDATSPLLSSSSHKCSWTCIRHYSDLFIYIVTGCSVMFLSVELGAGLGMLTALIVRIINKYLN